MGEKPTFERSEDTIKLVEYFANAAPDSEHSWREIAEATGVYMGVGPGRDAARRALAMAGHRAGHMPIPGWGLRICGPESLHGVSEKRRCRIRRQLVMARSEIEGTLDGFGNFLTADTRKALEDRRAMLGGLLGSSRRQWGKLPAPRSVEVSAPMLPRAAGE